MSDDERGRSWARFKDDCHRWDLAYCAGCWERGEPVPDWWRDGEERPGDTCSCAMCRGRRAFVSYERTGGEPNWPLVNFWRARQEWLANAPRTVRLIVEPLADAKEE